MLEEIKKGISDKEKLMKRLDEMLEGRNPNEIQSRYDFLIDILSMMQPT